LTKSESFIHQLITAGRVENLKYDKITVVPFSEVCQDFRQPAKVLLRREMGCPIKIYSEVCYDPNADFDYAAMASSVHDGTYLFIYQLMQQIVDRLEKAETYNKQTGEPRALLGYDMTLHYTVGDFVIFDYFTESPDPERPFLTQQTNVYLPIAYELTYEEQGPKI
jgi:hypothetical protein